MYWNWLSRYLKGLFCDLRVNLLKYINCIFRKKKFWENEISYKYINLNIYEDICIKRRDGNREGVGWKGNWFLFYKMVMFLLGVWMDV